ncbi:MAG: aspartate-alanine antiporter [Muribaculaceae bacterium]|nr:aspartate-alanine antiporter [Muribaculaceae bacterium]
MDSFITLLRDHPIIPLFFTLGAGFWLGHLKYKSFSLGAVAATLLVGVLVGQLGIKIPEMVKSIFFMLFLFSIGYSVGPLFFRSFRGSGLKQLLFALTGALVSAGTVLAAAKIMGYDMGIAGGLFAGSQTASASLGVMGETLRGMDLPDADREATISMITACYAVTYIFGTIGTAWFLSNVGPWLLGGINKVLAETAAIENELDDGIYEPSPGFINARRPISFRAFTADGEYFNEPKTVREIDDFFAERGLRVFVERLRINGEICEPEEDLIVSKGDTIVLSARREVMVNDVIALGQEVVDPELLNFGVEKLDVTISKCGTNGITFGELRFKPYMKGVIVAAVKRTGMNLPGKNKLRLQRGDILTLVGQPAQVAHAAEKIGYADRERNETDMVLLGFGVAIGCLIGVLAFHIHGVPVSLSTSGGALIAGLVFGWLRERRPTFGQIPKSVVWLLDNMGLNMFIAVVGINAGTTFLAGLHQAGWGLFFVGILCTVAALTINIFIARKLFRFSSPETLGCVAGARCGVASIGAIQDTLNSNVPMIGYTVTYAAANIILVFSSLIVFFLA